MSASPLFSVVMATYNRGRHIVPSIEAVLAQRLDDFEFLIIGDGCSDETADAVRPFLSDRVRWHNLENRGGSQSFPNNAGVERARGRYVAYCGHDDIWTADHLEALARAFAARPEAGFAASGGIIHPPPGVDLHRVTGLFEGDEAPFRHFFPPSTIAHRREIFAELGGGWRAPWEIGPPVDVELLLRAAHAGVRFAPTGRVTVHKFSSAERYLSYLRKSSAEQREMLERTSEPDHAAYVERIVEKARRDGTLMTMMYPDYSSYQKGDAWRATSTARGVTKPALQPLSEKVVIRQKDEFRGLDWYALKAGRSFRWSGPSPRPRILIPYSGSRATIRLRIRHDAGFDPRRDLGAFVNERETPVRVQTLWPFGRRRHAILSLDCALLMDDYTIIELMLDPAKLRRRGNGVRGIGLGAITLIP